MARPEPPPASADEAGIASPATATEVGLEFVGERDVLAVRDRKRLAITEGAIVTPLARDTADRYAVELVVVARAAPTAAAEAPAEGARAEESACAPIERGVVALGADHGGVAMKDALREFLESEGWRPLDFGTHGPESVDYPDYAHKVAGAVARGEARFGIVVDGVGVGSCMAANRHRGVRAALGAGILEVTNAREHNDANVLCLGGRTMGDLQARAMTSVFLTTPHAGGRHARRVRKIEPA